MRALYKKRRKQHVCTRCGGKPLYKRTVLCCACRELACTYFRVYNKKHPRRAKSQKDGSYYRTPKYKAKKRAYHRKRWKNPVIREILKKRSNNFLRSYRKTARQKAYILAYNRAYRKTPKGLASDKAHYHNRKAGRCGNGTWTPSQFITLCKKQKQRCACCGRRRKLTPDHVRPISKGGRNSISNLQAFCLPCNISKGNKTDSYVCVCGRYHKKGTKWLL